jgi:hypothetical protein
MSSATSREPGIATAAAAACSVVPTSLNHNNNDRN